MGWKEFIEEINKYDSILIVAVYNNNSCMTDEIITVEAEKSETVYEDDSEILWVQSYPVTKPDKIEIGDEPESYTLMYYDKTISVAALW